MAMLETLVCSLSVNRPVRTRTLGGVGAGVRNPRLPDSKSEEVKLNDRLTVYSIEHV